MENTSWKERVVERPSLWRREDITSGLFSRGDMWLAWDKDGGDGGRRRHLRE